MLFSKEKQKTVLLIIPAIVLNATMKIIFFFLRKPCLIIFQSLRNLKDTQNPYEILLVQLTNNGFGLSMIPPSY